jgi:hypothetical protein
MIHSMTESSVPQIKDELSHYSHTHNRKRDKGQESILDELIKFSDESTSRWERNRIRKLDQIPCSIDSVLADASTIYPSLAEAEIPPSPVDSLFPEHSMASSDSKVIPTWVPATKAERIHYRGLDGGKIRCWSEIRERESISAWMSEEIERRRTKHEADQGTSSNVIATIPGSEVEIATKVDRYDFTSNTSGSIMPNHIIAYLSPEITIVSPTMLSKEEKGEEGGDMIVPGWTQESIDEAWRQFQPRPRRRLVEPYETVLATLDERVWYSSGSGSDGGSIRTVKFEPVMVVEPGEEYECDSGHREESGSSDSSTGTVRYVGRAGRSGVRVEDIARR